MLVTGKNERKKKKERKDASWHWQMGLVGLVWQLEMGSWGSVFVCVY